MSLSHPQLRRHHGDAPLGVRLANAVTGLMGSWRFIAIQTVLVIAWIALNLVAIVNHWDPYPFILLNLLFSVQAAYTGPVLLLAGNRQSQKDRLTLEHAAYEADKADEQNVEILKAIERNTEVTISILRHVEVLIEDHVNKAKEPGTART